MSIEAVAWALNARVGDPLSKLVLIALANHSNQDDACWPSRRTIAEYAECSIDTVDRRLARLAEKGLITKSERRTSSGDQTSNCYYLNVGPLPAATPAARSGHPAAELGGPNHKGTNGATEVAPGAGGKSSSIKSKVPTTLEALKIAEIFNRKPDRPWLDKEIRSFKKIHSDVALDDLETLHAYYAHERSKGGDGIHRRDLFTFLNNYQGELDRANAWKADPKANEKTAKPSRAHQRGHSNRNAGTFNEGKGASYAGFERTS